MNRYLVSAAVVCAVAISFVIAKERAQAQYISPQGMTAIAGGAVTNNQESAAVFVTEILPGYRDWRLVSVAREEGKLNDIAIQAYREGMLPFPDGTIIARIAWSFVPSAENNKIFSSVQSFVPGPQPDWYLQFMVKDSKKYAATGGWGVRSI